MAEDRTPSPDPEDNNVREDNELHDTSEKYICSGCDREDYFEYTTNEDDACCKGCGHKKCDDCKSA
ncbi:hypothetical protein F4679DRAFT_550719 [Xylaria curta]|nr:hypothetical protein F4679DRAFT_550719 [Xylaria curta]